MTASHEDSAGLWKHNPALVQLLGLCPLLAVSNSAVTALGLGLVTLLVFTASGFTVSLLRRQIVPAIRLPAFVLIIATFTTCAELSMQAYAYSLYQALGIFVPLIVSNSSILWRAEVFASKNPPLVSMFDGLMTGLGFCAVLLTLGLVREALGTGAIFANMEQLLPFAANLELVLFETETPFLLMLLPPGAFLCLGFLLALKNVIDRHRPNPAAEAVEPGSRRVRVTGGV